MDPFIPPPDPRLESTDFVSLVTAQGFPCFPNKVQSYRMNWLLNRMWSYCVSASRKLSTKDILLINHVHIFHGNELLYTR